MDLTPCRVAGVLRLRGAGLAPLTDVQRRAAALDALNRRVASSAADPGSLALRARVEGVAALLSDDARRFLDSVPVLWLETALPDARIFSRGSVPAIAVCAGLFELVHFQCTLPVLCSLLQDTELGRVRISGDPDDDMTLADCAMLAGHVVLSDAYAELRHLPTLAQMLGPRARRNIELGVSASMALLLLHECGHIALGHSRRGTTRNNELEADAWSIAALSDLGRAVILPSLLSLHGAFQFFQTFGAGLGDGYPDADERLEAMVAKLGIEGDTAAIARGLLDAARQRRTMVAAVPATPAAMLLRFRKVMEPVDAWRFFRGLEDRLTNSGIILEVAGDADGSGLT
jgi:hypothetical protein